MDKLHIINSLDALHRVRFFRGKRNGQEEKRDAEQNPFHYSPITSYREITTDKHEEHATTVATATPTKFDGLHVSVSLCKLKRVLG